MDTTSLISVLQTLIGREVAVVSVFGTSFTGTLTVAENDVVILSPAGTVSAVFNLPLIADVFVPEPAP